MPPNSKGPAARGVRAEPSKASSFGGVDTPIDRQNPAPPQAEYSPATAPFLRLVEKSVGFVWPPRPRRLAVRITVRDGPAPHGRSRLFKIKKADFEELLAAAEKLEARR
jgi:hypothetical protein